MEPVRVATPITSQPIVSKNTAQPGKAVSIVIENAKEAPQSPEDAPIDPNSPAERAMLPDEPWHQSPLFYEMANFLGVEARDYEGMAEKISVVTDWAIQETNSNKIEDIMHTIRGLEDKLQPPPWGERRVDNLYRFLRIESRYNATKKALGAFTKTGRW